MIDWIMDNLPWLINQVETIGFVAILFGAAILAVAGALAIDAWREEIDNG